MITLRIKNAQRRCKSRRPCETRTLKWTFKHAPASRFRSVPTASRVSWRPRRGEPNLSVFCIPLFATKPDVKSLVYHDATYGRRVTTPRDVVADRRIGRGSRIHPPRSAALTARSILLFAQFRPVPVTSCSPRAVVPLFPLAA